MTPHGSAQGGVIEAALQTLHLTYRPWHLVGHARPRLPVGTVADVEYSAEEYEVLCEAAAAGGRESHRLRLPCPVFRPGMYLRAVVVGHDADDDLYVPERRGGNAHARGRSSKLPESCCVLSHVFACIYRYYTRVVRTRSNLRSGTTGVCVRQV